MIVSEEFATCRGDAGVRRGGRLVVAGGECDAAPRHVGVDRDPMVICEYAASTSSKVIEQLFGFGVATEAVALDLGQHHEVLERLGGVGSDRSFAHRK